MDVEGTIKRLQESKGVIGVLITDSLGRAIKSTMDEELTTKYATLLKQLCDKARSVIREMDSTNDAKMLRLRTEKNEIMIVPDKDFIVSVVYEKSSL